MRPRIKPQQAAFAPVLLFFLMPGVARADFVVLLNGARYDGTIVTSSPEAITIQADGAQWTFPREKIASFKRDAASTAQARENESRHVREWRAQDAARSLRLEEERLEREKRRAAADAQARERGETERRNAPVILYGTSWCPSCKAAREFMTDRAIPFVDLDVEADPEAAEAKAAKCRSIGRPGCGVPLLDVHGAILYGFSGVRIEAAFRAEAVKPKPPGAVPGTMPRNAPVEPAPIATSPVPAARVVTYPVARY